MRRQGVVSAVVAALITAGLVAGNAAQAQLSAPSALPTVATLTLRPACAKTHPGTARCFAALVTAPRPAPAGGAAGTSDRPLAGPPAGTGYGPADLRSAYQLPSTTAGRGRTVAVVASFDDPNAAADLAVYRAAFGLPACTTASGCLRKVNQGGGTKLPTPDAGWATEESLDLDMVSAACPLCRILLVEANDANDPSLAAAVDTAVRMGAVAVSNSYGDFESASQLRVLDSHYHHPGIAITAASGDQGYGVEFPAASPYVTAVGGTTLNRIRGGRGWFETVWAGTGSGCSAFEPKPAWQHDGACSRRTVADVAVVADPATAVAVYDTYASAGGWIGVGGTSVGAPLVAAMFALAQLPGQGASLPYARPGAFIDVVQGTNNPSLLDGLSYTSDYLSSGQVSSSGFDHTPIVQELVNPCPGGYLCNARAGYDAPTGLGTPRGVAGF